MATALFQGERVTNVIYNQPYTSVINSNMKFQLEVRNFSSDWQISSTTDKRNFINGAIDGVDVMSDHLRIDSNRTGGEDDTSGGDRNYAYHIAKIGEPGERVVTGNRYRAIESLANSCDAVSSPDWEEIVQDHKGRDRTCRQLYSKEAGKTTIQAVAYVDGMLVDEDSFIIPYTVTNYQDHGPKALYLADSFITEQQEKYLTLQEKIRKMVQEGTILKELKTPKDIYDIHTTKRGREWKYSGIWSKELDDSSDDVNEWTNTVTFTLSYGMNDYDTVFSDEHVVFTLDNYGTSEEILNKLAEEEITKLKKYLNELAAALNAEMDKAVLAVFPADVTGFYTAGQTTYYYWLHYGKRMQEYNEGFSITVSYTLKWGIDDTSNTFSSKKKGYDNTNYQTATVELTDLGNKEIEELLNYLDGLSGIKLVTTNSAGSQEIPAYSRDPSGKAIVLSAKKFSSAADTHVKAMLHFDGDVMVDETGSSWSTSGGNPIMTSDNAAIGKGMLVSDGRYISSSNIPLGGDSFTVDFFAFVNSNAPDNSCLCDINHPSCDIKIKLLKDTKSVTIGFYVQNTLAAQSKVDIIVDNTTSHFAVVYQKSKTALFFFVNGIMVGNKANPISRQDTKVYFNREVSASRSTFIGTIDEIRISDGIARWTPDVDFQEYDATKVVDEAGAIWQMYNGEVTPAPMGKGKFENTSNHGYTTGLHFDNTTFVANRGTKFSSSEQNSQPWISECFYAELMTPITMGGSDFTIDFWYSLDTTENKKGGMFEITFINPDTKKISSLGAHHPGSLCIHGYNSGTQWINRQTSKGSANVLHHLAMVYTHSTQMFKIYRDGVSFADVSAKKSGLDKPCDFHLTVGKYFSGGGQNGAMCGAIDEFRISVGIARWTSNFTPPTEPYEIDDYTKALMRTSVFEPPEQQQEEEEEDFEVDNPNHIFNPPVDSYSVSPQTTIITYEEQGDYYIPLAEYFDDDKFTLIKKYPVQKKPYPTYDGVHTLEPIWDNYDPQQLQLGGETSAKTAGIHWAEFTPWNDHLWATTNTNTKKILWVIASARVEKYPEQEEPLTYNEHEQQVNLINFLDKITTLSGTVSATEANDIDTPYYKAYATLDENYVWPSGMGGPYEIKWTIKASTVAKPVLKSTSSLEFDYNGTEQGPEFDYDSDKIDILNTISATNANADKNGNLLTTENSTITGRLYTVTFSLKNKRSTSWEYVETDPNHTHENDGTDDISFFWIIKRQTVPTFTVTNTSLVYKPEDQGPTLSPSTWDNTVVSVTDTVGQEVEKHKATFTILDINNYEWADGGAEERYQDWEITQAPGEISLKLDNAAVTSLELKAPPATPTKQLTVTKTGPGAVSVSNGVYTGLDYSYAKYDDYVTVDISSDNTTVTIAGIKSTERNQPLKLRFTLAESKNYTSATVDINVTVSMGLEAFTWEQIADMAAAGTLLNASFIGDTKTVKLKTKLPVINPEGEVLTQYDDSEDYAVKLILIGVDHNADVEGNKKAHFMLGKMGNGKDIVFPNNADIKMFTASTNAYGWRNSNLNLKLQTPESGVYYSNILPADFLAVMTPCIKWTDNIGGGTNDVHFVTPTVDYVAIPSEYEVFGTSSYANSEESKHQKQYEYFKNGNFTRRERTDGSATNGWALRSVNRTNSGQVTAVNNQGNLISAPISSVLDIVPIFTVSRKKADVPVIPAIDQCIEALMHFDDPNDPFKDECMTTFNILKMVNGGTDIPTSATVSNSNAREGWGGALQFPKVEVTNKPYTASTKLYGEIYAKQTIPLVLGGKDFTIDFWVYYDDASCNIDGYQARVFVLSGNNNRPFVYAHRTAKAKGDSSKITAGVILDSQYFRQVEGRSSSADYRYRRTDPSIVKVINHWVHVAMVYIHTRKKLFIYFNGIISTQSASGSGSVQVIDVTFPYDKYTLTLGGLKSSGTCMVGAVDELRIQNGIARWVPENTELFTRAPNSVDEGRIFTPPTEPSQTESSDVIHNQVTGGYEIRLSNKIPSKDIAITQHAGKLNIINSHPNIASAILQDDIISITGLMTGRTTVTIYTEDTDTTYGTVRILDIICDDTIGLPQLSDCDPANIKGIITGGNAGVAWKVGDKTKDISLSGTVNGKSVNKTVKATLIGIDHNKEVETENNFNAHFMISDLDINLPMNDIATNEGGWASSKMKQTFCLQLLNCFPTAWKNMISYCTKMTDNTGTGVNSSEADITSSQDKLFLPSEKEIFNQVLQGNTTENNHQKRYSYFETKASIPNTWTRSPVRNANSNSFVVSTGSAASSQTATTERKTVFCFCVSNYAGATELDENMSSFISTAIAFNGATHDPIEEQIIKTQGNAKVINTYFTWDGDTTGSDAKTYTLYIKPKIGYVWYGTKTNERRPVNWTINPPSAETIKVQKNGQDVSSVRVYANNPTETLTVVRNSTSTLTATAADPTLVSCSVNGNTVTISPAGVGTTTVTITSSAAGNYGAGSATVTVNASNIPALNTLTPSEIQAVVVAGNAALAWDVGDVTANIPVKGTFCGLNVDTNLRAFILGFDHNSTVEGTNRLHLCLGKNVSNKNVAFNNLIVSDNFTGNTLPEYEKWKVRQLLLDSVSCLPSEWQNVISPCLKWVGTQSVTDPFWLMSEKEITGNYNVTSAEQTQRYTYYDNGNSTIHYSYSNTDTAVMWFTRNFGNTQQFIRIATSSGGTSKVSNYTAKSTQAAILPCFTIAVTKPSPNLTANPTSVSTTVGSTANISVTKTGTGTVSVVSDNTSIATVAPSGTSYQISGVQTGSTNIRISVTETDTLSSQTLLVPVTVGSVQKTAATINLNDTSLSVTVGNTGSTTYTVTGGTVSSVKTNYSSIATVAHDSGNKKITVTGVAVGTAVVTVSVTGDSTHNNTTATINVSVASAPVTTTKLSEENTKITFDNSLTYSSGTLLLVKNALTGYSETYHNLSGDVSAMNRKDDGNYSVTVTPKSGYEWNGGGTASKNIPWNLKRATASIALNPTSLSLVKGTGSTTTKDVTYTITGDGTLTKDTNSNPSLVTPTVNTSTHKISFSSACNRDEDVTITFKVAATVNWTEATAEIKVSVRQTDLQIVPTASGKDKLNIAKAAATYDENTEYTITSSNVTTWITGFNSTYHEVDKITNSAGTTVTKMSGADTYSISVVPADGYAWDSTGDVSAKVLSWTINRKSLGVTTVTQTGLTNKTTTNDFVYDGKSHKPVFDVSDTKINVVVTAQTDAGNFNIASTKAKVTPKSNYCWSNNTYVEKEISWRIDQATGSISGNNNVSLVKGIGATTSTTVTYTVVGGSLSYSSNNSNGLVTVSVNNNNNQVTFSSACTSNASSIITLQTAETTNYTSATLDVTVNVSMTSLTVLAAQYNKDVLSVIKEAGVYNTSTTAYSITNAKLGDWVSAFDKKYHQLNRVTDSEGVTVTNTGTTTITYKPQAAGTYYIEIIPKSGYAWDDTGNTDPLKLAWTINRQPLSVAQPTLQGLQVNGGTTKKTNFDYKAGTTYVPYFDITKNVTVEVTPQTNAGNYNTENTMAKVTPTANYCWLGGLYDTKKISWHIDQIEGSVSCKTTSNSSIELTRGSTESKMVEYNITGDGTVSVIDDPDNPNLVTWTIDPDNYKKITYASSFAAGGTATLTVKMGAGTNYKEATAIQTVTVKLTSLTPLAAEYRKDKLTIKKDPVEYDQNTTYGITSTTVSDWINGFNSTYHKFSQVTDSEGVAVATSGSSTSKSYNIKNAGTYYIEILVNGSTKCWDETGDVTAARIPYTINKKSINVADVVQVSLSGKTTNSMEYDGLSHTPVFGITGTSGAVLTGNFFTVTATAQTDAKTYSTTAAKATLTPTANYRWSDNATTKKVNWTIEEQKIALPVFNGNISSDGTTNKKPAATDFTNYDENKMTYTAPTTGAKNTGTYDSTTASSTQAKFQPKTNYCWPDGTTTKIIVAWSISGKVVSKPSIAAAYTVAYDPSASDGQGPTITNHKATNDPDVTVTASNKIAVAYTASNTTGFTNDTTVRFKATGAGKYKLIYTLKDTQNSSWAGGGTDPVTIEYEIKRATIPTTEVPTKPANLTVKYTISGTTITYTKQKPAFATSTKYTYSCAEQDKADTYSGTTNGALFTPTANYQWSTSTQSKTIEPYAVPWTIAKAEGFVQVKQGTKTVTSIDLTNEQYTFNFTILATGSITPTKPTMCDVTATDTGYTLTGKKTGTGNLVIKSAASDNFTKAELTIPVSLSVVKLTAKKPTNFMKNLFAYLEWERITNNSKAALDSALKQSTNNKVTSFDMIISEMKTIADTVKSKIGSYQASTTFVDKTLPYLLSYFGIKVEGTWKKYGTKYYMESDPDSGSIVGKDIGESTTNISLSNIVKENSPSTIGSYPTSAQTIQGCRFIYPAKSTLTADQQWVIQAANTWWFKNSLLLIEQAYGLSFNSPHVISKHVNAGSAKDTNGNSISYDAYDYDRHDMVVYFIDDPDSNALASCGDLAANPEYNKIPYTLGTASGDDVSPRFLGMRYNTSYLAYLDKTNKDGPASQTAEGKQTLFDTITLHELTHGVMYAVLTAFQAYKETPAWFVEGTAELMRGIDTERPIEMAKLIVDADLMQNAYNVTHEDYATNPNKTYSYALGYMIFRYMIKQWMDGKYN